MRIRETHKNGAQIEVFGLFGVAKTVKAWRDDQTSLMNSSPSEDKPKTGFHP